MNIIIRRTTADYNTARKFIMLAPYTYKTFQTKSANGKIRKIQNPNRSTKVLQRVVMHELSEEHREHKAATAYVKGQGIKSNALKHAKNKYLLKLDFSNFFAYFNEKIIIQWAMRNGFTYNDALSLSRIVTYYDNKTKTYRLSVGAPSSPMMSNLLMSQFDELMQQYCKKKKVTYTRYSDDMTFSTQEPFVLSEIESQVQLILEKVEYKNLTINKTKTVSVSSARSRVITGVHITTDGLLSIGKKRKGVIRAMLHQLNLGYLSTSEIPRLNGYLSFAKHIEPTFYYRIRSKNKHAFMIIAGYMKSHKRLSKFDVITV